ncbi:hypothetical protein CASFOL_031220 [Castilleja foliolosa]|uniref:Uncharacterized protein n=1 Tax=Castilleja foliolosa TaxID=1961234 RepID=A0ABD3C4R6_9LAMI
MEAIVRATSLVTRVRFEATSTGIGAPAPQNRNPPAAATPLLSISKPSWVVKSESNIRKERITKPDPPCVVCRGSGRVDCSDCNGRGRTNHIQLTMLPKGEWPKWCRRCGGSGLGYCNRCVGTGEYRYIMGFHFMNKESNRVQDNQVGNFQGSQTFSELLLNNDQCGLDNER